MTDSSVEAVARAGWCAPGDDQKDRWLVRFNDPDMREALYSGPDAEREARAKWEAMCGPSGTWNGYLFRLAALPPPEREPMREALEEAKADIEYTLSELSNSPILTATKLTLLVRKIDAALAPPTAQSGDRT